MFDEKTRAEICQIAADLNVEPEALMAVAEVESGGQTYAMVAGRREPLIRFEGHYFDRFLEGDARLRARSEGLASPKPGAVKNPRRQEARWDMLNRAIAINRIAALSSASWGLGQVMGSHWQWLGYGSVDALVVEARSGVSGQVALMARYIRKAGLIDALVNQDWARFARVYNGPGYAKNRYDVRMAAAYRRYVSEGASSKGSLPVAVRDGEKRLMFGARGQDVRNLQTLLRKRGYILAVDGLFGLVTDRAVRLFQKDVGLPATGIFGKAEWKNAQMPLKSARKKNIVGKALSKPRAVKIPNHIANSFRQLKRRIHDRTLSIFGRFT